MALHLSLHLCLCKSLLTLLFLLNKIRVLSYTKHGTVLTTTGWAVVTSRTHIARYDLLVCKECTTAIFCLVSRTTSFSLIDKSCFEVYILVTSFYLESLQLIVWNVMDTVNRTSLNSNCNSFVIISPLLELSATLQKSIMSTWSEAIKNYQKSLERLTTLALPCSPSIKKVDCAIIAQLVQPIHVTSSTYTCCDRIGSSASSSHSTCV